MPIQPKYFQIPMSPVSPASSSISKKPHPKAPKPLLRLEFRDLSHQGAKNFLQCHGFDCGTVLEEAVNGVLNLLYSAHSHIPPTRSVTLILRSMPGVAYTTGRDIDDDHKEIHFSTDYIAGIPKERRKEELLGVIRHEMVHCWQWNALGTAPGGLIEGIADWVRLRSDLVPPHWKREVDGDWDAGYQHTGYFLDFLEEKYGEGSVMAVNEKLRNVKYDEDKFWKALFSHDVAHLWKEYGRKHGKKEQKTITDWVKSDSDQHNDDSLVKEEPA
jgi:predicted SprT family Zn-dependent metalloprotease